MPRLPEHAAIARRGLSVGGPAKPPGCEDFWRSGGKRREKVGGKRVCSLQEGKGRKRGQEAEAPERGRKEQGQAKELQENSHSTAAAATFIKPAEKEEFWET